MCRIIAGFLIVGLIYGSAHEARAIATATIAVSAENPADHGYSFDWNYVYNCKGSSGMAVDHYWLLTAAHVADDLGTTLVIDGETYTQQEVVFHAQANDPDDNATADIALIRYDKPFPGYYPLATTVPVGQEVLICGYGRTGDVVRTVSTAYFTETGTAHNVRRWGTNKIDAEATQSYTGPSPLGMTENRGFNISISTTKVSAGGTPYEAGCNIYDSGGGMFYNDGGIWMLAGHMTSRYGSGTFSGNFAVATKYYVNWIKSVIIDYDTDMDGLPDWWETQYGGGATSMDAGIDQDGDDFSNYLEWIADTVPTNGSSFFNMGIDTNATSLVFTSSSNREYQIQYRLDLMNANESWQTEVDWFPGEYLQTTKPVTAPTSNRFYRIRAKLPYDG